MLLGEHAVLHGHPALVASIAHRVTARASTFEPGKARILSALGERVVSLDAIDASEPLEFVCAAIESVADHLTEGLELSIEADMPPDIGFGTSAAVTVACRAAVHALLGQPISPDELHRDCLDLVRGIQGRASGADVAASVYGGVLLYRTDPVSIESLKAAPPLVVAYSGHKEKTADVIAMVDARHHEQADLVNALFDVAGNLSIQASDVTREGEWSLLGQCLNAGQEVMESLGVSNDHLESMIEELRNAPGVRGAKISGAGLGDCIVGIGNAEGATLSYELLPASVDSQGVRIEQDV